MFADPRCSMYLHLPETYVIRRLWVYTIYLLKSPTGMSCWYLVNELLHPYIKAGWIGPFYIGEMNQVTTTNPARHPDPGKSIKSLGSL